MTRRRIEIIVETEREIVLNRRADTFKFCSYCNKIAPMIMLEDAAARAGVSVNTVYRWLESGSLHFTETAEEGLLVCEMSLGLVVGG